MIELDLIKSPNQSFKFKDFDITIRLTKNDTYIQILKNGVLILPFIKIKKEPHGTLCTMPFLLIATLKIIFLLLLQKFLSFYQWLFYLTL